MRCSLGHQPLGGTRGINHAIAIHLERARQAGAQRGFCAGEGCGIQHLTGHALCLQAGALGVRGPQLFLVGSQPERAAGGEGAACIHLRRPGVPEVERRFAESQLSRVVIHHHQMPHARRRGTAQARIDDSHRQPGLHERMGTGRADDASADHKDVGGLHGACAVEEGGLQPDAPAERVRVVDQQGRFGTHVGAATQCGDELAIVLQRVAGLELAAAVRDKILAKGGKYVAVATMPDLGNTPFGNSAQVGAAKPVLTALSATFNVWLREGLTNQPVQILDLFDFFNTVVANPTTYGMTNVTSPACDVAKISTITGGQVATGSSLFCNSTPGAIYNTLVTAPVAASATTWLFADDVHPTTGGHKLLSDVATEKLKAFGWI